MTALPRAATALCIALTALAERGSWVASRIQEDTLLHAALSKVDKTNVLVEELSLVTGGNWNLQAAGQCWVTGIRTCRGQGSGGNMFMSWSSGEDDTFFIELYESDVAKYGEDENRTKFAASMDDVDELPAWYETNVCARLQVKQGHATLMSRFSGRANHRWQQLLPDAGCGPFTVEQIADTVMKIASKMRAQTMHGVDQEWLRLDCYKPQAVGRIFIGIPLRVVRALGKEGGLSKYADIFGNAFEWKDGRCGNVTKALRKHCHQWLFDRATEALDSGKSCEAVENAYLLGIVQQLHMEMQRDAKGVDASLDEIARYNAAMNWLSVPAKQIEKQSFFPKLLGQLTGIAKKAQAKTKQRQPPMQNRETRPYYQGFKPDGGGTVNEPGLSTTCQAFQVENLQRGIC